MSGPRFEDIVSYWADRRDEDGLGVDWSEATTRCWRCAYRTKLQKCHIVPHSRGGSATVDNLVLLCGRCHREAPNHINPEYMWRWIRATCVPFYDAYWTARGFDEFSSMFGRIPFAWLADDEARLAEAHVILREELARTTVHFGEGRLNPATIACVLADVERQVADEAAEVPEPTDRGFAGRKLMKLLFPQG